MTPDNPALLPHLFVFSDPSRRSPEELLAVVAQFDVAHSLRYQPRELFRPGHIDTFCNIFASDVARAMGVQLPHWVDDAGKPTMPGHGRELAVDGMIVWLGKHGPAYGWRQCSEVEARTNAAAGRFSVVTWNPPGAVGHIAVIVPSPAKVTITTIAQAGRTCFPSGSIYAGFGAHVPECQFWAAP